MSFQTEPIPSGGGVVLVTASGADALGDGCEVLNQNFQDIVDMVNALEVAICSSELTNPMLVDLDMNTHNIVGCSGISSQDTVFSPLEIDGTYGISFNNGGVFFNNEYTNVNTSVFNVHSPHYISLKTYSTRYGIVVDSGYTLRLQSASSMYIYAAGTNSLIDMQAGGDINITAGDAGGYHIQLTTPQGDISLNGGGCIYLNSVASIQMLSNGGFSLSTNYDTSITSSGTINFTANGHVQLYSNNDYVSINAGTDMRLYAGTNMNLMPGTSLRCIAPQYVYVNANEHISFRCVDGSLSLTSDYLQINDLMFPTSLSGTAGQALMADGLGAVYFGDILTLADLGGVPYIGTTQNVDLGGYTLYAANIQSPIGDLNIGSYGDVNITANSGYVNITANSSYVNITANSTYIFVETVCEINAGISVNIHSAYTNIYGTLYLGGSDWESAHCKLGAHYITSICSYIGTSNTTTAYTQFLSVGCTLYLPYTTDGPTGGAIAGISGLYSYGTITGSNHLLTKPDSWLPISVGGNSFVIPLFNA